MNRSLEFKNINIVYDKIATQNAYKNKFNPVMKYLADNELKNSANNYLNIKNKIYNSELKNLLNTLGIDIEKENEFIHYKADKNLITEVKFDFIGQIENPISKKPWFYEVDEIAINVHFSNNQNGRHEIFSDKQTSRIEITLIEESRTRDNNK